MTHQEQMDLLQGSFKEFIEKIEFDRAGCPVVWVKADQILVILDHLKKTEGLEYEFLADLTAYDLQGTDEESLGRFVIVYNLFSPAYMLRLRVKTRVAEDQPALSAVGVWVGANWAEREVFDMFGVRFEKHPDLRRILMDVRWVGHPLRKDYPLRKYQLFTDAEEIPLELLKD